VRSEKSGLAKVSKAIRSSLSVFFFNVLLM